MKKTIYMLACIILNVVAIFVFRKHLIISGASSTAIIAMALLAFWTWHFKTATENGIETNVGTADLSPDEIDRLNKCIAAISYGTIPLLIPFMFFFEDKVKLIVPWILVSAVVIVGIFYFRLRYGKNVKNRIKAEMAEKEEQEKRERE
ncbi:MAG: hypothetical protein IJW10_04470 [Clostridia bacterium]|nr:hypothetical protein [Clostridia bacterium]